MSSNTTHSGSSPSIWAIDDEQDIIHSMGGLLEDSGFSFRGFIDPREALEALELAGSEPDLFIVDLNMPHMTGVEVVRELRGRPSSATTPVLVVTALSSESSLLNAFDAGADEVLRKPVGTAELLARIAGQLKRSRRIERLRQQNRDLNLLTRLANVLNQSNELPEVLRALVDGVRQALNLPLAAFYLAASDGDLHRALPADPSRSEGSPNISLDLRTLPAAADNLAARSTTLLGPADTELLLKAIGGVHADFGDNPSSAVFPLVTAGKLVGVMVLVGGRPNVGGAGREGFICSIIADLAAVAVDRAELFHSLRAEHARIDHANRELAESRAFLENVIGSSPDAVVASNRAGKIVLFNHAAERILGWRAEEALGDDVRKLYPQGSAERVMHMMRSDRFGPEGRLEPRREILVDKTGRKIPVEISATIIETEDGEEVATVGIFTDLRNRIEMEEQLQEATEHLERSRRQAVIAELAGAAAHELNQPLTSLLGYAELLSRKIPEDDDTRRAVDVIYRESHRIADVVRKIGRMTDYKTKEYVGSTRIADLDVEDPPGLEQTTEQTEDPRNKRGE